MRAKKARRIRHQAHHMIKTDNPPGINQANVQSLARRLRRNPWIAGERIKLWGEK